MWSYIISFPDTCTLHTLQPLNIFRTVSVVCGAGISWTSWALLTSIQWQRQGSLPLSGRGPQSLRLGLIWMRCPLRWGPRGFCLLSRSLFIQTIYRIYMFTHRTATRKASLLVISIKR